MPSAEEPLTGQCACGTVRFEVTKPFDTAGYCHCKRCPPAPHPGALWSETRDQSASDGFRFTAGEDSRAHVWRAPRTGCRSRSAASAAAT